MLQSFQTGTSKVIKLRLLHVWENFHTNNIPNPPINLADICNEVYQVAVSYSGANDGTPCGKTIQLSLLRKCIVAFRERQPEGVIDVEFRSTYDVVERVPAVFCPLHDNIPMMDRRYPSKPPHNIPLWGIFPPQFPSQPVDVLITHYRLPRIYFSYLGPNLKLFSE